MFSNYTSQKHLPLKTAKLNFCVSHKKLKLMCLTPGVLPFNYSRPPKGRTVDDMTEEAQYLRQGVKIGNKFKTCMSLMRIVLLEDVQILLF